MTKKLDKLAQIINSIFEWSGVVLLFILIVACVLQVFTRKVMGASLQGTEECARYCFIWVVFFGVNLCVARGGHAAVDLLNSALKGRVKDIHNIILQVMMGIVAVILIYQGFKMCSLTMKQLSPTLQIPMSLIYLSIPVSSIGMVVNIANNIVKLIHNNDGKENS